MQDNIIESILKQMFTRGLEQFGRFYSVYRGFVWNREDPLKYSRLQIIIPEITGTKPHLYWAWPVGGFAGEGYGMQVLPQVGDVVWVQFEKGHTKKPVWSHGYFGNDGQGGVEKPEELSGYGNYWFKTPGGHVIDTCLNIIFT